MVERLVANEKVEGSSPFARSKEIENKMSDLANKKCVPCEGGIPAFDINRFTNILKRLMVGMSLKTQKIIFTLIKNLNLKIILKVSNLF